MEKNERPVPPEILKEIHALVEANRLQCLWFMKEGYLPLSVGDADRALMHIEVRGDRHAWARARDLRSWLSRNTSAAS